MIHRTPEPRLEPDHRFDEEDELETDFIQPEEMEMSDEEILDIYHWLIGLGQWIVPIIVLRLKKIFLAPFAVGVKNEPLPAVKTTMSF